MFTPEAIIDTVQNGKKQFVNTFVQNETIKESLIKFVDAQADYTKTAVKVGIDTATTLSSELTRAMRDFGKFDYLKFGEGIMKAYSAQQKK